MPAEIALEDQQRISALKGSTNATLLGTNLRRFAVVRQPRLPEISVLAAVDGGEHPVAPPGVSWTLVLEMRENPPLLVAPDLEG
jgi:hypothetical protein